jgi:hypothetical protein
MNSDAMGVDIDVIYDLMDWSSVGNGALGQYPGLGVSVLGPEKEPNPTPKHVHWESDPPGYYTTGPVPTLDQKPSKKRKRGH